MIHNSIDYNKIFVGTWRPVVTAQSWNPISLVSFDLGVVLVPVLVVTVNTGIVGPEALSLQVTYQVLFFILFPVIFLAFFLCLALVIKFLIAHNTWMGILSTM